MGAGGGSAAGPAPEPTAAASSGSPPVVQSPGSLHSAAAHLLPGPASMPQDPSLGPARRLVALESPEQAGECPKVRPSHGWLHQPCARFLGGCQRVGSAGPSLPTAVTVIKSACAGLPALPWLTSDTPVLLPPVITPQMSRPHSKSRPRLCLGGNPHSDRTRWTAHCGGPSVSKTVYGKESARERGSVGPV